MIVARGYFAVGLCLPRDPKNVASALRACGCFEGAMLAYSGKRYEKHAADTQKAYRHMPLVRAGESPSAILDVLPYDCVPVAVELEARAEAADAEVSRLRGHLQNIASKHCWNPHETAAYALKEPR